MTWHTKTAMYDSNILRYAAMLPVHDTGDGTTMGARHPQIELAVTPVWRFTPDQKRLVGVPVEPLLRVFKTREDAEGYGDVPKHQSHVVFWHGQEQTGNQFFLDLPYVRENDPVREWVQNGWVNIHHLKTSAVAAEEAVASSRKDEKDLPIPTAYPNCFTLDLKSIMYAAECAAKDHLIGEWRKGQKLSSSKRVFRAYSSLQAVQGGSFYQNQLFLVGKTPIVEGRDGKERVVRKSNIIVFSEATWIEIVFAYLHGMDPLSTDGKQPSPYQNVLAELARRGPWPGILLNQDPPTEMATVGTSSLDDDGQEEGDGDEGGDSAQVS